MASIVFLRAINVGGANLCKPAQLAKSFRELDIVNIGAVGTFVVRNQISQPLLRKKLAARLNKFFRIKCEIMIVPARDLIAIAAKNPFRREKTGPEITPFVSVLHKQPRKVPALPLCLPSPDDCLLKIITIERQFVIGVYRREMKAIGYLGKIEKILDAPATTRSWGTIEKVLKVLSANS